MIDPNTGEPIILPGRRVLVAPQIQALSLNQLMQAQAGLEVHPGRRHAGPTTPLAGQRRGQPADGPVDHDGHQPAVLKQLMLAWPGGRPTPATTGSTATRRPSPTWRIGRSRYS